MTRGVGCGEVHEIKRSDAARRRITQAVGYDAGNALRFAGVGKEVDLCSPMVWRQRVRGTVRRTVALLEEPKFRLTRGDGRRQARVVRDIKHARNVRALHRVQRAALRAARWVVVQLPTVTVRTVEWSTREHPGVVWQGDGDVCVGSRIERVWAAKQAREGRERRKERRLKRVGSEAIDRDDQDVAEGALAARRRRDWLTGARFVGGVAAAERRETRGHSSKRERDEVRPRLRALHREHHTAKRKRADLVRPSPVARRASASANEIASECADLGR